MNNEYQNFKIFLEERMRDRGLNLKRLSEVSGISINNLENLINENFEELPATPYIRGYLMRLGKILDFNYEPWWDYFQKQKVKSSGPQDRLPKNRFETKSLINYFLIIFIILLAVLYIFLRFDFILGKPKVEVNISDFTSTKEKNFLIKGKVQNADKLFINSSETPIAPDGTFQKEILLNSGINIIEIKAKKILGKETKVIKQIFYEEQNMPVQQTTTQQIPPQSPSIPEVKY
jgi:cytoskeletal protein RodZ